MEVCKKSLGALSETDQLLFRVLATSGMRLGEAFETTRRLRSLFQLSFQNEVTSHWSLRYAVWHASLMARRDDFGAG